jgi:Uma2 family endonuclease
VDTDGHASGCPPSRQVAASLTPRARDSNLSRVADPAKRSATYEDLLAVPWPLVAEIIHGTLVTHPRPAARHAWAATLLGGRLSGPFNLGDGGPGGWVILDEPELHLGGHVLVPDMAGWRRQQMPEMPDTSAFDIVPDWVCEILSPSTAAIDRADKMPIYASLGVSYAWLIDPSVRTLETYRLAAGSYVVRGQYRDEAVVRAEPFDAIELAIGPLWSR